MSRWGGANGREAIENQENRQLDYIANKKDSLVLDTIALYFCILGLSEMATAIVVITHANPNLWAGLLCGIQAVEIPGSMVIVRGLAKLGLV